eukprot:6188128-Pleurochrysis_carterae.AAC.1
MQVDCGACHAKSLGARVSALSRTTYFATTGRLSRQGSAAHQQRTAGRIQVTARHCNWLSSNVYPVGLQAILTAFLLYAIAALRLPGAGDMECAV